MTKPSENFKLSYSKTAVKEIRKLDSVTKKKLQRKIEQYIKDPIVHAKKLTNSELGEYRWRVGNYRIVFDLKRNTIIILRVGHRKEIYK